MGASSFLSSPKPLYEPHGTEVKPVRGNEVERVATRRVILQGVMGCLEDTRGDLVPFLPEGGGARYVQVSW